MGEKPESLTSFCSACMRRSTFFYELKSNNSILFEKLLVVNNHQESKRVFQVCILCKLAIDFLVQFEKLCETSRHIADNWDVIDIRTEIDEENNDPKVQNALATICTWFTNVLEENVKLYKIDKVPSTIASVKQEEEEETFDPSVKTETYLEEYFVETDYDDEIDADIVDVLEVNNEIQSKPKKKGPVSKQVFSCEIDGCNSKFLINRSLTAHMDEVHGVSKSPDKKVKSNSFICPDCNFSASSELKLNRHLQSAHNVVIKKVFSCDICDQICPSKCRLRYHMNCHLNISPFVCDFKGCTRAFRNPTRLRNHKQEFHLQVIRMHCAVCGKGFRTKASHDLHILGHDKPTLPCEYCGRLLTNRKTLRTHLMTHTGERRYKCEVEGCNKKFTKCSGLQVHMRSHTKEKPYACPQCFITFAYKVSMKKHMLKVHDVPLETSTHIKPVTQFTNHKTPLGNDIQIQTVS